MGGEMIKHVQTYHDCSGVISVFSSSDKFCNVTAGMFAKDRFSHLSVRLHSNVCLLTSPGRARRIKGWDFVPFHNLARKILLRNMPVILLSDRLCLIYMYLRKVRGLSA